MKEWLIGIAPDIGLLVFSMFVCALGCFTTYIHIRHRKFRRNHTVWQKAWREEMKRRYELDTVARNPSDSH